MAAVFTLKALAERLSTRSAEYGGIVENATGAVDARDTALAGFPADVDGIPLDTIEVELLAAENTGETLFTYAATARYELGGASGSILPAGTQATSFDTTGATAHITQSLEVSNSYAPGAGVPKDHKGAIGVGADGRIAGTDITVGQFQFSISRVIADLDLDTAAIFALTGKQNNATWKGYNAGEVLFLGARGSQRSASDPWEMTFLFKAEPNRTGLEVGTITGIAKKGQEYLDVTYDEVEDDAADPPGVASRPVAVYAHRVYEEGTFTTLGVGS